MPEQFGGIGLRNPFIPFLLVRDQLASDPEACMEVFLRDEREAYKAANTNFEELSTKDKLLQLKKIYGDLAAPHGSSFPNPENFMTMDEYTRSRESISSSLLTVFEDLMRAPNAKDVSISQDVRHALEKLEEA